MHTLIFRPATRRDIPQLFDLIDIATAGFAPHIFACLAPPGSDVRLIMQARMEDPGSQLSFTKALLVDSDDQLAGLLMTTPIADPADLVDADTPPILRPLFELESQAPGTTLVNFVAAFPKMRGRGIGTALMKKADETCGAKGMSLTIHDRNNGARHLYEKLGYREVARRRIVKQGWDHPATDLLLMTKPRSV